MSFAESPRGEVIISPTVLGVPGCRYDGVAGYASCGNPRGLPPLALESCDENSCSARAWIDMDRRTAAR